MRVRLRPEARIDIFKASCFYDEKSPGWGDKCIESIFDDFDRLSRMAGVHSKRGRYYRMYSDKFPFAICYDIDGMDIVVIAVLSCRMSPSMIDSTLDQR
jgi:hypothetical protein